MRKNEKKKTSRNETRCTKTHCPFLLKHTEADMSCRKVTHLMVFLVSRSFLGNRFTCNKKLFRSLKPLRNKKLLGAKGIATNGARTLLGAPGIAANGAFLLLGTRALLLGTRSY